MNRAEWIAATLVLTAMIAPSVRADEVTYFEKDGIKYQKIRQVNQRPITELRYEQQQSTAYRERYTTDLQESHRTYQVPVTEQQWVPGYQRSWNLLAPPVLSYRLMPVTRWETRSETVRIPITKREVYPETVTHQVPKYSTRYAEEETVRHVAIGTTANGTPSVARSESTGLAAPEGEAPREGSTDWRGGLELRR
jgi:hypothetical protein